MSATYSGLVNVVNKKMKVVLVWSKLGLLVGGELAEVKEGKTTSMIRDEPERLKR